MRLGFAPSCLSTVPEMNDSLGSQGYCQNYDTINIFWACGGILAKRAILYSSALTITWLE
jgi:hypothetical protein